MNKWNKHVVPGLTSFSFSTWFGLFLNGTGGFPCNSANNYCECFNHNICLTAVALNNSKCNHQEKENKPKPGSIQKQNKE